MDPGMRHGHDMMHSHGWMGGHGMNAFMSWAPLEMLLCLALLVGITWLVISWLNYRYMSARLSSAQPQDAYQSYEQGYQARQPLPETYQEGEREYHYHQPRHSQILIEIEYPQQEMPRQQ
jgi:hypothetical protein